MLGVAETKNHKICIWFLITLTAFSVWEVQSNGQTKEPSKTVDFNRDIRPILSDNCFACHGPDDNKRQARLRFDVKEGAFAKQGVIIPGEPSKSLLIQRVAAEDKGMRMPPLETGRTLTAHQVSLLRRWIEEGAKWDTHWAYLPARRRDAPNVNNRSWPRNAIDNFILARLEREGHKPSQEADKGTLLRRVTLDLTGLPPTPHEIDAFLADPSPDAYEKRVDELLRSLHYGERMALHWLDLARYADTHGYHIDSHREMWRWRDWVINAFNRNLHYDQFTIEQLAGDLLPNATLEQKIASGFNRNHMINFEGGAIPEEYQTEYVVDRVEATANVWLGMTVGCARCHSHKFDPITQKEFYQFFAFFNTVSEEGLDGRTGNAKPFLPLPSAEQEAQLVQVTKKVKELETSVSDTLVAPAQSEWETNYVGKIAAAPQQGLLAHYEFDGNFSDLSGHYRHGHTVNGDPTFGSGQVGKSVALDGDTQISFGDVGSFDREDKFTLSLWLKGSSNTPISGLQKIENAEMRRGWEMSFDDLELVGIQRRAAQLSIRLISRWPQNALQIQTTERLVLGDWHHVVVSYDGSGKASGLKLHVNGKPRELLITKDTLSGSIKTDAALQVGDRMLGKPFKGQLDDLRIYDRMLSESEIEQLAIHYPVQNILSGVTGKRTKEEAARVREYFLTYAAPEVMRKANSDLKDLRKERDKIEKSIPTAMVMDEMPKPRESYVLARGDYRNHGEKVTPGVPSVLPPLPKGALPSRLTLARWLVDPAHPLTARVAVNRFWQIYFGYGIVKTAEDFGSQGESPIHPELLDWLATEFIRMDWDIRALQRLIVTSATYRQSSKTSPEMEERDPENRLLARGPRFRLPAELVRDNALAIAGLLNRELGGPSVFPYHPQGLWEETAFGDGFSAQTYTPSTEKDLYRRSLYTFWKRTVPPPSLGVFDAPDREKCTARRALTNTPLQALVLMNDPTYMEAARALAQRTLREAGKDAAGRVGYAFRLATARKPSVEEVRVLKDLYAMQLMHYRRDKNAAIQLLSVGESKWDSRFDSAELAAWTIVATAVLNLDETITKE